MRFSAILPFLGTISSALAAPNSVPSQDLAIESIFNATALGVDVYGPIPSDAVKVSKGHYTAEPGTKAWAWIRAQSDLTSEKGSESKLEKRQQYANIGVSMFVGDLCTGQAVWWDNVLYSYNYYTTVNMFSVGIRYRSLRVDERLDFSRGNGFNYCGTHLYSIERSAPVGCFNSQLVNCFRIDLIT
ncbi:hypothetical protein HRG_008345 [Hirsutella rhossiliensis]|uniref:Uncharacterized protein n=1 Tax=Hirsutella rhossiliensis TaxID=111463 RepID=A0A9P8MRZ6_9HYPO|nr:uncharacterized protein HRG_08345 [Hirsutella rhossiliensis]KAH0960190.1 hypothetical protein HRG_08345 [Hirsutella rhossiliensis]